MGAADQRYQQDNHGFSKLMAVKRLSTGWRRCFPDETPDAVVSRVFGPSTFAVVSNGEIDGLSGLVPGDTLGVVLNAPIAVNGAPIVAKVVTPDSIIVNVQSYASTTSQSSNSASFYAIQEQLLTTISDLDALEVSTTETDADLQAQIDTLNTQITAVNPTLLRQYAWSVAS